MSEALKAKKPTGAAKPPKVVVRRHRSKTMPAVTPAMKERLRAKAKTSTRSSFPELPEWRLES
ncbi:MAG TPA: hypothetical protein VF534_28300 [Paraburkholderia sp.]